MEPERVFRSKIGLELLLPLCGLLGWALVMTIAEEKWLGVAIMGLTIGFVASFLLKTYYKVTQDKKLKIVCGFFSYPPIEVSTIKQITKTRNPLGSPALSLDRLAISYNKYDTVMVSPKDKTEFVQYLQRMNPAIEVKM